MPLQHISPVWHRSIYVYRKRGLHFPMFDLPDQIASCGMFLTVPTQALTLLNDEFVLRQSKLFADRVEEAARGDSAKQVDLCVPDRKLGVDFLQKRSLADFNPVLLNLNEAVQHPIAIHDLHAAMLHLLGIDHTRLSYLFHWLDHADHRRKR